MPFDFYQNYIDNIAKSYKDSHLQMKQNQIDALFYNSTQCETVKEQTTIGVDIYHDIDVIIDTAIDTSTGTKLSDDFKLLAFRSISHKALLGRQYKFSEQTWITTNNSDIASPTNDTVVRRCNNTLKWINDGGKLCSYPCILGYDVSSPQPKEEKSIITPNNSITLIVQGNEDTLSLSVNQRFIFNKRPYKLSGINNVLQNSMVDENTTLLYYDLYLDTILPTDDLVNNIAAGKENKYEIKILDNIVEQVKGFTGDLDCTILLNDENSNLEVTWSGNENVAVDQNGTYTLVGEIGAIAIIKATIKNTNISDEISINIVSQVTNDYKLVLNPIVESISQYSRASFTSYFYNNGVINSHPLIVAHEGENGTYSISYNIPKGLYDLDNSTIKELGELKLESFDGIRLISIDCLKPSKVPLSITFENKELGFKENIKIELKSMF